MTIKFLIEAAYGIKDAQLIGAPAWSESERFDVEAKADGKPRPDSIYSQPNNGTSSLC